MRNAFFAAIIAVAVTVFGSPAYAQRCDIPREARDIWRCENGFVIGPENVIIRLPIPETDPEALYNAGIEAAQREDWRIAIAYFTAAQQRAHLVPRYMYNLGLAHARAGNDVAAIAWFSAYLVTEPNTSNRAAIWDQIATLEARTNQEMEALWTGAVQAADTLPTIALLPGSPDSARSGAYFTLAVAAGRSLNWDRANDFIQREFDLRSATPGAYSTSSDDIVQRGRAVRGSARNAAILIYDLATTESLNRELQSEPSEEPERSRWATLRHARPRLEWNWPSSVARGEVLASVDVANRNANQFFNDRTKPTHLAAQGDSEGALSVLVSGPAPSAFLGEPSRGLEALHVGEILLLRGDVAGATRALAVARRFINDASRHSTNVDRISALLAAERGDLDSAVLLLTASAWRLNSEGVYSADGNRCCLELGATLSPQHQWSEFRHYAAAQVVQFLFWRGQIEEALALNDEMDSLRGGALLQYGESVTRDEAARNTIRQAREALALRASGGATLAPERRQVIEDAVITARRLPGAAYDLERWVARIPRAPDAQTQATNLLRPAEELALGLRMIRISYARSGGNWGE